MARLLPYLEQGNLYRQFDLEKGYAGNCPAVQTRIKTFLCPALKDVATVDAVTTYVAMADGSVHFISFSVDPRMLAAMVTIDGGEQIDSEWASR